MTVIAFFFGYCVWESAARVDVAVEDVDKAVPAFLPRQAGEEDGCYVWVGYPGVDETDALGMSAGNDN